MSSARAVLILAPGGAVTGTPVVSCIGDQNLDVACLPIQETLYKYVIFVYTVYPRPQLV